MFDSSIELVSHYSFIKRFELKPLCRRTCEFLKTIIHDTDLLLQFFLLSSPTFNSRLVTGNVDLYFHWFISNRL